jgi:hypothetical protein
VNACDRRYVGWYMSGLAVSAPEKAALCTNQSEY